jgi:hypothetical protein
MFYLHVQSDLLVVKKQKMRFCPIYFQKVCYATFHNSYQIVYIDLTWILTTSIMVQEDIERELTKVSKASRGTALSKQIMVCS